MRNDTTVTIGTINLLGCFIVPLWGLPFWQGVGLAFLWSFSLWGYVFVQNFLHGKLGYLVSVEKRLPRYHKEVLVTDGVDYWKAYLAPDGFGWISLDTRYSSTPVKYWMRLPR